MRWMEGLEGRMKQSSVLEGQEVAEEETEGKVRWLKSRSVFTTLLQGGWSEMLHGKGKQEKGRV